MQWCIVWFSPLKKQKVITARHFTAFPNPPLSLKETREQFRAPRDLGSFPVVAWAGEAAEGREGEQPALPAEQGPLPAMAGGQLGPQGCSPKGEVFGAACRRCQQGVLLGGEGTVPGAGETTQPPRAMAALGVRALGDRDGVAGRALCCPAANGRTAEAAAANRSVGMP